MGAVYTMEADVSVLEEFARRCSTENLVECFARNRQLVTLLLSDHLLEILDPDVKVAKYGALEVYQLFRSWRSLETPVNC